MCTDDSDHGAIRLTRFHRVALICGLLGMIAFGAMVELRGAFQHTRKTDAGVFFRAGWAVRADKGIYDVSDDNGWHYAYPPVFAILMAPLSDPPSGTDRSGSLPYPVSLAIWYVMNCFFWFLGAHVLAEAWENTAHSATLRAQPRYCQRWWAMRVWPSLICLLPMGENLSRGQVGTLIFLLLALTARALLRQKPFRAGMWMAGAMALKGIPAFLILLPLVRRRWNMAAGCAAGLLLTLLIIPLATLGPHRTIESYHDLVNEVLVPGILSDHRASRGPELTGIRSTSNCSPLAVFHNLLHPDRNTRPEFVSPLTRVAYAVSILILTMLTFLPIWVDRKRPSEEPPPDSGHPCVFPYATQLHGKRADSTIGLQTDHAARIDVLLLASLSVLMNMASPVYHPHYFSQSAFPVMVLLALQFERNSYPRVERSFVVVSAGIILGYAIWLATEGSFLRDFGYVLASSLLLWAACVRETKWAMESPLS
jgi:hypothetical protein